jgi:hypothetical protein
MANLDWNEFRDRVHAVAGKTRTRERAMPAALRARTVRWCGREIQAVRFGQVHDHLQLAAYPPVTLDFQR